LLPADLLTIAVCEGNPMCG